ncbi:MAG TPA: T9SS type A sorting domain-containing protein [Saprospiraceae bacterium]|nr:T9SS type A sorting domain-containing protein [Saprospiraceae bacterium]
MMKKIVSLWFGIWVIGPVAAQTFSVGHRQLTFIDAERNDRPILTELYYPAATPGDNVPVSDVGGETYPVVAFGHGFVMEWSAYANFWNALVPKGYIIAFPRTETGISPDHLAFARDLAYVIHAVQEEGRTMGSPFFGRVDSTSCVMGHSMGGGSSFLAVEFNEDITAVANFAAAETNPSAIEVCPTIKIPALVFAGENDCITPPETNQSLMYTSLASDCKTLVQISGASHCQFAEQNVFCSFGELTCSPAPEISRTAQHRYVDTLLVPWLAYHLKGSCQASVDFQHILTTSNEWTALQDCNPCIPLSTTVLVKEPSFQVYPMPSSGDFYLEGPSGLQPRMICIYNVYGVPVDQQKLESTKNGLWEINTRLHPGVYSIVVSYAELIETLKLIIQ